MNTLYITVAPPGAGKTTAIRNLNLEQYTLSPDTYREHVAGVIRQIGSNDTEMWGYDGHTENDQKSETEVFKTLKRHLKLRLIKGGPIIWESTGLYKNITDVVKLAKEYDYRIVSILDDSTTLEQLIINNSKRERKLPDSVIEIYFNRKSTRSSLSEIECFKTSEYDGSFQNALQAAFQKWSGFYLQDFNNWNDIHILSDIHGQYDTVLPFLNSVVENENDLHIIAGDLFDRGPKSIELMKWLLKYGNSKNLICIMGNHDIQFYTFLKKSTEHKKYVDMVVDNVKKMFGKDIDKEQASKLLNGITFETKIEDYIGNQTNQTVKEFKKEFMTTIDVFDRVQDFKWYHKIKAFSKYVPKPKTVKTKVGTKQIVEKEYIETRESLRRIMRNFKNYLYFTYKDQKYFINHGGIDKMTHGISNSVLLGRDTLGEYSEYIKVAELWNKNHPDIIQIFGHRNVTPSLLEEPFKIGHSYCLDNYSPSGNTVPVLSLANKTIELLENKDLMGIENPNIEFKVDKKTIEALNRDLLDITSYPELGLKALNFSRKAFNTGQINETLGLFRGMWLYDDYSIASRSFTKFYNFNEKTETTLDYIINNFKFPIEASVKYNGFMLSVFYNKNTNELNYATKRRVNDGMLIENAMEVLLPNIDDLTSICKNEDCTLVFECVLPIKDRHIVIHETNDNHCVFIGKFDNSLEFNHTCDKSTYDQMFLTNDNPNLHFRETIILNNVIELEDFILKVNNDFSSGLEGYVLKDASDDPQWVKLKTPYYIIKKNIRSAIENNRQRRFPIKNSHVMEMVANNVYHDIRQDRNVWFEHITPELINNYKNKMEG